MMFTSFLVKDNKTRSTAVLEDFQAGQDIDCRVDHAINHGVDRLRQQLSLCAIATISTDTAIESSHFTIHYAEPDCGLYLCQLINSHRLKIWVQHLSPFHVCQFAPINQRHIYCCQYYRQQTRAQYVNVWSQTE